MAGTSEAASPPLKTFRSIDVPGVQITRSNAINNRGMIVGVTIRLSDDATTGFVQIGRFVTAIKHPQADDNWATEPTGINDRGDVTGFYLENPGLRGRAFLLSRGEFATIDIPGAIDVRASGINNKGKVVGAFLGEFSDDHSFLFDGSVVTIIDVPHGFNTSAVGINDKDQIVGDFRGITFASRGFLLSKGVYQTIHVPGSEAPRSGPSIIVARSLEITG